MKVLIEKDSITRYAVNMPRRFGRVSNFHALTPEQQAEHGWHSASIIKPDIDHSTQRHGEPSVAAVGPVATITYAVEPLPVAEALGGLKARAESHMDEIAQARQWNDRYTVTARAGYVNPWQAEAIAFAQWMDSAYEYLITEQGKVVAGTRSMPTGDELIGELPLMVWPV